MHVQRIGYRWYRRQQAGHADCARRMGSLQPEAAVLSKVAQTDPPQSSLDRTGPRPTRTTLLELELAGGMLLFLLPVSLFSSTTGLSTINHTADAALSLIHRHPCTTYLSTGYMAD